MMCPKYIRHVGQIEALLHEYEDEVLRLNRMIEEESCEKTEKYLKELRDDHINAKKKLERFLNDNPNIFK